MSFLPGKRTRKNRWKKVKAEEIAPPSRGLSMHEDDGKIFGLEDKGDSILAVHTKADHRGQQILLDATIFKSLPPESIIEITFEEEGNSNAIYCFDNRMEYHTDILKNRPDKISIDVEFSMKQFGYKVAGQSVKWRRLLDSETEKLNLTSVEITFKNQYFSLRDIAQINKSLEGRFVKVGDEICLDGFDFKLEELNREEESNVDRNTKVSFGVIREQLTKINYCSLSSCMLITVEISKEAVNFSNQGDLTINR